MQLLLAMEYQEKVLANLQQGGLQQHDTHLQFPWAIGVLADDVGVTFIYMSPGQDKWVCVLTPLLEWTNLNAIFACLGVIRVRQPTTRNACYLLGLQQYAHLFWDELLLYAHGSNATKRAPPTRRSQLPLTVSEPNEPVVGRCLSGLQAALSGTALDSMLESRSSSSSSAHSPEHKRPRHALLNIRMSLADLVPLTVPFSLPAQLIQPQGRVFSFVRDESVRVKLFASSEESEALHEFQVLHKLRSHSGHFVDLVGWTRLDGRFALVTHAISVRRRHFLPANAVDFLRYATSLCEVWIGLSVVAC